jgi:hypothetical protein
MRHEVESNPSGLIEVEHGLGTMRLEVKCETAAGEPIGFLGAVPIDDERVGVATVPGSDVAVVHVTERIATK